MSTLPASPINRRYGAKRDFHDSRDLTMALAPALRTEVLRDKVDLSEWCGDIKDQADEGSCVGHAYSSFLEFLFRKYDTTAPIFSPQFAYTEGLLMEGSFPEDNGLQPRTGCLILNKFGCCLESTMPYAAGDILKPTQAAVDEAGKYKIGAYHRIDKPIDVLYCINSNYPCTIGFQVYSSFESQQVADTGLMPVPDMMKEQLLGGHEVLAIGYDMTKEAVLIQNSWGTGWGQKGKFWLPYMVLSNAELVTDVWMVHFGKPWR